MRTSASELREMYEDQRLTTREISARVGVHRGILREWFVEAGIKPRAPGRGLAHRGIPGPGADELRRLIHDEHKTYKEVADIYGAHLTAIPHWLDKHGIPRGTHAMSHFRGAPPPTEASTKMVARYQSGDSADVIANHYGCSEAHILVLLRKAGVPRRRSGWNPHASFITSVGVEVKSSYELRVANWLEKNRVTYEYEPPLPFGRGRLSDFLANGWWIEVWGVRDSPTYRARQIEKRRLYREHGLPLIEISFFHFRRAQAHVLQRRLDQALQPPEGCGD